MKELVAAPLGEHQIEPVIPHIVSAPELPVSVADAPGIAARIAEKVNAVTSLPYSLLARWHNREPGSALAALDQLGPAGKMLSGAGESVGDLVEKLGAANVLQVLQLGKTAVLTVLSVKGLASAPSYSNTIQPSDIGLEMTGSHKMDIAQDTAPLAANMDANNLDEVPKGSKNPLYAEYIDKMHGSRDPKESYYVPLPEDEYNAKTGHGTTWTEGVYRAEIMGYDALTEPQKAKLDKHLLAFNDVFTETKARTMQGYTMPDEATFEKWLREIGAKYDETADTRADPLDKEKTPTDTPPVDDGTPTQPATPPLPSPTDAPPAQPTPTPSAAATPTAEPVIPKTSASPSGEALDSPGTDHSKTNEATFLDKFLDQDKDVWIRSGVIAGLGAAIFAAYGFVIEPYLAARGAEHDASIDDGAGNRERIEALDTIIDTLTKEARDYLRAHGYRGDVHVLNPVVAAKLKDFHIDHGRWPTTRAEFTAYDPIDD